MAEKTNKLKIGDLVQLKSGGPAMTIKSLPVDEFEDQVIICQWFGGRKLEQGKFAHATLIPAPEEKK